MSRTIRIESSFVGRRGRIARRGRGLRRRHSVTPEAVQPLESRRMLSQTFTVTNTNNDYNPGSLDWAMLQVNTDTSDSASSPDVIDFDIPGTGPFTLPSASFQGINDPVIIDGYSQPGSSPNTLTQGDNAKIQIVLSGALSLPFGFGLSISGGNSVVEGLAITDCPIDIQLLEPLGVSPSPPAGNDVIKGCFLGTDATGEQGVQGAFGNDTALEINGVGGNTIGGTAPSDRNIISAGATNSLSYGIWVTGSGTNDNLIEGDYIGTDASGNKSLGNNQGISFYQAGTGNTVGGRVAGAGNVISGSVNTGLITSGNTPGLLVEGNFIGTNAAGTAALPNGTEDANNPGSDLAPGLTVGTAGNTIGGTTPGSGNLISGNINDGIDILDYDFGTYPGGVDNLVEGNLIGTDVTGTKALPNRNEGIGLSQGAQSNTIGGTQAGAGNVISGNDSWGIYLDQSSGHNLIQGNFVGTNAQGTGALTNYRGVEVDSPANTIGGTAAGAGNVISGNTWGGINIGASSFDNLIQGNLIGTSVTGDTAIPNGFLSYYFLSGVMLFGNDNTVGGTSAGAGNVISGNGSDGLDIIGPYYGGSGQHNLVEGNLIGVGADGTTPLGDGAGGISIFGQAAYNTIGGLAAGAGNVIADSQHRQGLNVGGSNSDNCPGNEILSNSIYNNAVLGIDLGFNGVNQNMPGGPFQGPNDLQNYPVLTQALTFPSDSAIVITGTLNSDPATTFTVQFFANPNADPSGHGQGQILIGTITATTDIYGNASFTATFPGREIPVGDAISATATDPSGEYLGVLGGRHGLRRSDAHRGRRRQLQHRREYDPHRRRPRRPGQRLLGARRPGHVAGRRQPVARFAHPEPRRLVHLQPDSGYTGTDSFTYDDVADGQTSNVATVTISVNPKTLYVTNTNDSGPGSLRQALTDADRVE